MGVTGAISFFAISQAVRTDLLWNLMMTTSIADPQSIWAQLRKTDSDSEPEFLKIVKCNSAASASAGFRFNYFYIFNGKTLSRGIWTTFQVYSVLSRRIFSIGTRKL